MERMVNVQILFLLAILLALSLACAIGSTIRTHVYGDDMWYLLLDDGGESNPVSASKFVKDVLTFILTLNNLIPISCVVWFSFADGFAFVTSHAPLTSQRRVQHRLIVTMEVVKFQQAAFINNDLGTCGFR